MYPFKERILIHLLKKKKKKMKSESAHLCLCVCVAFQKCYDGGGGRQLQWHEEEREGGVIRSGCGGSGSKPGPQP